MAAGSRALKFMLEWVNEAAPGPGYQPTSVQDKPRKFRTVRLKRKTAHPTRQADVGTGHSLVRRAPYPLSSRLALWGGLVSGEGLKRRSSWIPRRKNKHNLDKDGLKSETAHKGRGLRGRKSRKAEIAFLFLPAMEPMPPSQLPTATASTDQWVFPTPDAPPFLIPSGLNPATGEFIARAPKQRISLACNNCRQRRTKVGTAPQFRLISRDFSRLSGGKSICTGTYPSCERCIARKLPCGYPDERKRGRGPAKPKPKLSDPTLPTRPKNARRRFIKVDVGKSGNDYDASEMELQQFGPPLRHGGGHEAGGSLRNNHHTSPSTMLSLELPTSTHNSHFPGLHEYDYAESATYDLPPSAAYSGSSASASTSASSSSAYPSSSPTSISPYSTAYAGSFPHRPAPVLPRQYAIATSLTASYYSYYPNPGPPGATPYYPYPHPNANFIAMGMDMERERQVPISSPGQDHRAAWPLEAGYALHQHHYPAYSANDHSHSDADVDRSYNNAAAAREVDENDTGADDINIDPTLRLPLAPETSHTRTGAPSEDDHALNSNAAQVQVERRLDEPRPRIAAQTQTPRPRLQLRTRPALSLNMGLSRKPQARRTTSLGSTSLGSAVGSVGVNPAALRGARSFSADSADSAGSGSGWRSASAESASVGSRSAGSGESSALWVFADLAFICFNSRASAGKGLPPAGGNDVASFEALTLLSPAAMRRGRSGEGADVVREDGNDAEGDGDRAQVDALTAPGPSVSWRWLARRWARGDETRASTSAQIIIALWACDSALQLRLDADRGFLWGILVPIWVQALSLLLHSAVADQKAPVDDGLTNLRRLRLLSALPRPADPAALRVPVSLISYPPSPHPQSPDLIPTTTDDANPRAHSTYPHSPSPHPSSAHQSYSHSAPAPVPAPTHPYFNTPPTFARVELPSPSAFMYSAHAHAQTHAHVSRPSSANVSLEEFEELSGMYEPPSMQFAQNRAGADKPEPQYVAPVRAYSGPGTQPDAGQTFMTSIQERMGGFGAGGALSGGWEDFEGIGGWMEPPSMPISRASSSASIARPGSSASASARGVQGASSASGAYARTRTRTVSPVQEGGVGTPPSKTAARAVSSPVRAHGISLKDLLLWPVRAGAHTEPGGAQVGAGDEGEGEASLFSSPVRFSGFRWSPVRELGAEDADCETWPSASRPPFSASTPTDY
ncbi:hypothetical protein B0H16DRAFT_1468449 [Mycena metata]|uniref:Zn(2)-C6 fungal-type domain-containing protein n=1 Tax=Mycena metata TaxID=1033252 RepID=A0AAD7MVN4_9AGAR|nr:hypothetical protein B0H16DRAFT_1468449 [Mycena metata]